MRLKRLHGSVKPEGKTLKTRQQAILRLLLLKSSLQPHSCRCKWSSISAFSPAASAAGGSPMAVDPDIEVIYSGESDSSSDSKPSAKPDRTVAESKTAALRGSLDPELRHEMLGSSDDFGNSSPISNRSRLYSYEASVQHVDVRTHDDVDDGPRSHHSHIRSNARYCGSCGASVTLAPGKSIKIVTRYYLLLKTSHKCRP